MKNYLFEVCINFVESCIVVQEGGVNCVEFCVGIFEGGIILLYGEIVMVCEVLMIIWLYVIICLCGGDFFYFFVEVKIMLKDIEMVC